MSSPLDYVRAGVPIVPLKVSFENGRWRKRPHIKDWAARATTNEATIGAWWHSWPQAHIGVPLEPLNLVVIDADRHPGGPDGVAALSAIALPPHQAVVTMSNGEHRFFKQPAPPRIRFATFAGVQVLGDGKACCRLQSRAVRYARASVAEGFVGEVASATRGTPSVVRW